MYGGLREVTELLKRFALVILGGIKDDLAVDFVSEDVIREYQPHPRILEGILFSAPWQTPAQCNRRIRQDKKTNISVS